MRTLLRGGEGGVGAAPPQKKTLQKQLHGVQYLKDMRGENARVGNGSDP